MCLWADSLKIMQSGDHGISQCLLIVAPISKLDGIALMVAYPPPAIKLQYSAQ